MSISSLKYFSFSNQKRKIRIFSLALASHLLAELLSDSLSSNPRRINQIIYNHFHNMRKML